MEVGLLAIGQRKTRRAVKLAGLVVVMDCMALVEWLYSIASSIWLIRSSTLMFSSPVCLIVGINEVSH
jgi:hypothetical protein